MKHLLTHITGIGESTATLLAEHGIDSVKALLKGGEKGLCKVPGFGKVRAATVLAAAIELKDGAKSVDKPVTDKAKATKKAGKVAKAEAKATKKAEKEAKKGTKAAKKEARKSKKNKSKK